MWGRLRHGHEDKGTDCEDGDNDTDSYRWIESDMLCVLSVWN